MIRFPALRVWLVALTGLVGVVLAGSVQTTHPSSTRSAAAHARPTPHLAVPPARPHATPTPPALPLAPAHGMLPGWLHTQGAMVVDAHGRRVRLAGVNWNGAELSGFVPGGLDRRPYMDILRTVKYLGFNSIRLAISNELVERNPVIQSHVYANPQFKGKRALDVLDAIANGARQVGVMLILVDMRSDSHQSRQTWSFSSALWYSPPRYTQQSWVADWAALARRYRTNPAVVGFDLRNEPHSNGPGLEIVGMGYLRNGATWGPFAGIDNPVTDWRLAAEQAGNAILTVNPHALVIVEGTEIYPYRNPLAGPTCPYGIPATRGYCADLYWWAGNLLGARDYPVTLRVPHQLVYSPHEYGPRMHGQRWITPTMTEGDWQQQMHRHWGFLLDAATPQATPIWIGEFGTSTSGTSGISGRRGDSQGAWFSALIDYMRQHPAIGWAYWSLNGPTLRSGGNGYSLLTYDWAHLTQPRLLQALRSVQQ